MLTKEAVEEFKRIYKEHYGKEISNQEAYELGQNLLNVYRIVYRTSPVKEGEQENKNATSIRRTTITLYMYYPVIIRH